MTMMRLMMEAFMILAIAGGMVFMSKMSAAEKPGPRLIEGENVEDAEAKETDSPT